MHTAILLSLLPLLAVAAPHQQPGAGMKQGGMGCSPQGSNKAVKVGKAVYVITNEAQNSVLALPIGADGKLSAGKMAKTGGAGSSAVDAQGKPEAPDGLASQSALTVAGNVSLLRLSDHISRVRVLECDTRLTHFQESIRCQRRIQHTYHDGHFEPGPHSVDLRRQTSQGPRRVSQHCCCISKEQARLCWDHGRGSGYLLRELLRQRLGPNG